MILQIETEERVNGDDDNLDCLYINLDHVTSMSCDGETVIVRRSIGRPIAIRPYGRANNERAYELADAIAKAIGAGPGVIDVTTMIETDGGTRTHEERTRGQLFQLAQRMEDALIAQRDGHWSDDWDRSRDSVLADYDAWRAQ